jgi:neutrophil factor 2
MTEFYDDYIDSYRDQPQGAPIRRNNTIATWARNNANPETPPPPSRSPSTRPPPTSFSGASGVRRRGTTVSRQRSTVRRRNVYEEEEEGYGSGDYEDGSNYSEISKIRVKVRFKDEVRGLALTPDVPFADFMGMLSSKFSIPVRRLDVKFKDEDGGQVSLKDEMDYEMALETAKENAHGKAEGKLEVWCAET